MTTLPSLGTIPPRPASARAEAPRVVLALPDALPRRRVANALEQSGFHVTQAGTAAAALAALRRIPGAAVVVSEWLPDADGRDVCRSLRGVGDRVPVVLIGRHDTLADRLAAFAAQADDYVPLGTDAGEIAARLLAIMRRSATGGAAASTSWLDRDAVALRGGGRRVALTPTELRILRRLARSPGGVTRRRLWGAGWPEGGMCSDNALDACIARLRRKLGCVPGTPSIVTVRGVGYALVTEEGVGAA